MAQEVSYGIGSCKLTSLHLLWSDVSLSGVIEMAFHVDLPVFKLFDFRHAGRKMELA